MRKKRMLPLFLAAALFAGCAQDAAEAPPETPPDTRQGTGMAAAYVEPVEMGEVGLENEATALAASPAAISTLLMPEASGVSVEKNDRAVIDYSNIGDGYVMACFTGTTEKRLKVQVTGPSTTYTYDLAAGEWATFPLSDGNGEYKATVLENTTESKYAVVLSESFAVQLEDEFGPFLRPNQYVDYGNARQAIAKAAELAGNISDPLEKVAVVYDYVVANITYDKAKAETVQGGYLPVLDSVLSEKKGICFDYAALMTGMLRSQGVPCKLVVGYAGTAYHAWISVWTEETGWIDGVIFFNGTTWQRMDPTFASSSGGSEAIMQYIGDGSNYTQKYLY